MSVSPSCSHKLSATSSINMPNKSRSTVRRNGARTSDGVSRTDLHVTAHKLFHRIKSIKLLPSSTGVRSFLPALRTRIISFHLCVSGVRLMRRTILFRGLKLVSLIPSIVVRAVINELNPSAITFLNLAFGVQLTMFVFKIQIRIV